MVTNGVLSAAKAAVPLAMMLCCGFASADTLRVGGTGTALGSMRILAEAYEAQHPDMSIEVLPSLGSSGGIKAVIPEAIDLCLSARPLKDAEQAAGAQARVFARSPLVFATSLDNPADAITTQAIEAAFSGRILRWATGAPIRLVMRPVEEANTKILRGLSDGMALAVEQAFERPDLISATSDQDNADALERLSGSLGFIALGQIRTEKRRLKILALDDTAPEGVFAKGRENTLLKTIYVVSKQTLSPQTAQFRDFIYSDQAHDILLAHDFTPAWK